MFRKFFIPALAVLCLSGLGMEAAAVSVDSDSVYCFRPTDFSPEESLTGICITSVPDSRTGTVLLGTRVLRPGDILTAQQAGQMTFAPLRSEADATVQMEYLPIYSGHVAPCTAMTISIRGKEDKAPVAEDSAAETYKNLELQGKLKVADPEGQSMTYTLIRQPRRGTVTLNPDGSFIYTPKKNKVGVDSFVYTATDPAGKVSREATVTITILKPTQATQYTDTAGTSCRFTAEWMRNSGIFTGEDLAGNPCFHPEKAVTRGEFTAMLVKALDLPTQDTAALRYTDEIPQWLQPYLTAAIRSGLTAALPDQQTFGAKEPITGEEAAAMLCIALDLSADGAETQVLEAQGISLTADPLTRESAANALYRTAQLHAEANPFADRTV